MVRAPRNEAEPPSETWWQSRESNRDEQSRLFCGFPALFRVQQVSLFTSFFSLFSFLDLLHCHFAVQSEKLQKVSGCDGLNFSNNFPVFADFSSKLLFRHPPNFAQFPQNIAFIFLYFCIFYLFSVFNIKIKFYFINFSEFWERLGS